MKMQFAVLTLAVLSLGCFAQAGATTISYQLQSSGYGQDSVVSGTLFETSGLLLNSPTNLVTACGGNCLSSSTNDYTGTILGQFVNAGTTVGTTVSKLSFEVVTNNAVISLFDSSNSLVTVLNSTSGYSYTGTTGIEYFSAKLNYDGLNSQSYTASPVPEPGTLVLLGTGLAFAVGARMRSRGLVLPA